ncbi:hypothetical protein POM88_053658 [Heracleum sosnowskyi]|uniref:Uncharacterized protein n=1 Tax=Heracleum sosnowskyi TaxID=360622 RepID=A0AAD8GQ14_9APIA|nr:hypothetical protein POM88_053658 [Heracleum sosnowskyi]
MVGPVTYHVLYSLRHGLWVSKDICDVLKKKKGTEAVESNCEQCGSRTWFHMFLESLSHRHLPKRLFKVYSEFGHQIDVHVSEFMGQKTDPQWLDWIIESPYWTSESSESSDSESTTVYADLLPNESHNFMGIILCFQRPKYAPLGFGYSVKNTTSGFIWSSGGPDMFSNSWLMVIVPKSIFSVTDDDHRIELTTHVNVKFVGIHLLYNTETETTEAVVENHVITSMH